MPPVRRDTRSILFSVPHTLRRKHIQRVSPRVLYFSYHYGTTPFAFYFYVTVCVPEAGDHCPAVHTIPRKRFPLNPSLHNRRILRAIYRQQDILSTSVTVAISKTGILFIFLKSSEAVVAWHFSHSIQPSVSSKYKFLFTVPQIGHFTS